MGEGDEWWRYLVAVLTGVVPPNGSAKRMRGEVQAPFEELGVVLRRFRDEGLEASQGVAGSVSGEVRDAFVEAVDRLFGSGPGRDAVDSLVRAADDVARMAREFGYVLAKTTASLIGHALAFAAELAVTVAMSAWN
ncbi:hypothetical protein, partial [Streptomyces sp. NPDC086010]|uniref:hypothetical protein n=1 Tax=Streptomyces sp. NPDC086010 TaxID=3365745 RepID=UPI0037D96326